MDPLLRLGARAIATATDTTAGVRPTIAPVYLAGPSRPPDSFDPTPLDETGRSAATPMPSSLRPISPQPMETDLAADPAGPADRPALAERPEPAALRFRDSLPALGAVDRAAGDSDPIPAKPAHSAESRPDRNEWQTHRADPMWSDPLAALPLSVPLDRDRGRAGRTATRHQGARRAPDADVRLGASRATLGLPDPSKNDATREPRRTVSSGQQDALPSARFLATLRTIRDSVAAAERPRRGEEAERPPAVRVTIGRIEVRSVPAAAPEPPRTPTRPSESRITLAEYLSGKRRSPP